MMRGGGAKQNGIADKAWWRTRLLFVAMTALLISSLLVGWGIVAQLRTLEQPRDDVGWAIYQLGFEHQRLQLASETNAPMAVLRTRAEIYLSRLLLLQNAPAYQAIHVGVIGTRLEQLTHTAESLRTALAGGESSRQVIKEKIEADVPVVRELTQDLSELNRKQQADLRQSNARRLITFLVTLECLFVLLLIAGGWLLRINDQLGRAGRQIARKTADLDGILNAIEDGIIGLSKSGKLIYCSDRAAALMGWNTAAVIGQSMQSLSSHGPLLPAVKSIVHSLHDVETSGRTAEPAHVTVGEGTAQCHFEVRSVLVDAINPNAGGGICIISISDVTARENAQQQRDEYDGRIAQLSRLLTLATISGGIVHEISQPLSSIKNYVHLLRGAGEQKQARSVTARYLNSLGDEVDRVVEIVRNVRRMALDQQSDVGSCDLAEAVQNSIRLATFGKAKNVRVLCNLPHDNLAVMGSLPLIGQVLVNLIQNAVQASMRAGADHVEVSVTRKGNLGEVRVRDHGAGVDAAVADKIFLPFSGSSSGGMGLGLAICKRIIDGLGGEIRWRNAADGGAEFCFTVPMAESARA